MVDFFGPFSLAWGAATGRTPMEHLDPDAEDEEGGEDGRLNVPPPGQRHAAGYMEPDESRDYLEMMKRRQAQGLPPDPRDGGTERPGWGAGRGWGA